MQIESSYCAVLEIAAHIQRLLPDVKSGALCFWGVWFGRPHDNWHSVVGADAAGDCLSIQFNDEEVLQVWHPANWQIDAHQFIIFSASRVRWRWHWYGHPHTEDNLMSHDFVREAAEIAFRTTFPVKPLEKPNINAPAVQIH